jgi:ribosomal protein S18 acetylase RimI-like enzyme
MFVEPEQRGKGLGGKLLKLVIDHARQKMKVRSLLLSVEATNSSARALYEKYGFKKWGTEPRAMKVGESFLDEDQMVLLLD